jgi:hypothetical protein
MKPESLPALTKSTTVPARYITEAASMNTLIPPNSSTSSPVSDVVSRPRLYLRPEHPPEATLMRRPWVSSSRTLLMAATARSVTVSMATLLVTNGKPSVI